MKKLIVTALFSVLAISNTNAQRHPNGCFIGAGKSEAPGIAKDDYYVAGCEVFIAESLSLNASKGEIKGSDIDTSKTNVSLSKYIYWNRYADFLVTAERQKDEVDFSPAIRTNIVSLGYRIKHNNWLIRSDVQLRHIIGGHSKAGLKLDLGYSWQSGFGIGLKSIISKHEGTAVASVSYDFN